MRQNFEIDDKLITELNNFVLKNASEIPDQQGLTHLRKLALEMENSFQEPKGRKDKIEWHIALMTKFFSNYNEINFSDLCDFIELCHFQESSNIVEQFKREINKNQNQYSSLKKGLILKLLTYLDAQSYTYEEFACYTDVKNEQPWIWLLCIARIDWAKAIFVLPAIYKGSSDNELLEFYLDEWLERYGVNLILKAFKHWHSSKGLSSFILQWSKQRSENLFSMLNEVIQKEENVQQNVKSRSIQIYNFKRPVRSKRDIRNHLVKGFGVVRQESIQTLTNYKTKSRDRAYRGGTIIKNSAAHFASENRI